MLSFRGLFCCLYILLNGPIDIMSDIVAIAALRELYHENLRMRFTMAVLARWYRPVLLLVAERARHGLVFCRSCAQEVGGCRVAHTAVFRRHGVRKGSKLRHMGLVAEIASTGNLSLVGYMAPGAGRELAVHVMAVGAVEGGMLALIFPELPALRPMADKTNICARTLE